MQLAESETSAGPAILRLARSSIEHGIAHNEPLPVVYDGLPAALSEPGATFTTLRLDGDLRGCRGTLVATQALAKDVVCTAYLSAFDDPRFAPVADQELEALHLEVSVLSPLEPFPVSDEADLLDKLTPGTDGLVIIAGPRRATFLPKVWTQLPEPRKFLAALKKKAGLDPDFWAGDLEFQRYTTTVYAEG